MKIVFLDSATIGDISLEPIKKLGEFVAYKTSTDTEAMERVSDADILIVNKVKVTRNLINSAQNLKLICEAATGVNNIDIDAALEKGIKVKNVAGYSTDSVVQLTFAQILSLSTDIDRFDNEVKNGDYSQGGLFTDVSAPYMELSGKTLGIIGMGTIGQKVATVAESFGMKVIYYSTSGTSHCTLYRSVSLDELLEYSDIVSIHAPLNERTENLIGISELRRMKKRAIIVNMARGGIINEEDLATAINEESIAAAAIDVYTREPIPASSSLLSTGHPERLHFTPHVAWASREAIERLVAGVASNIRTFINDNC